MPGGEDAVQSLINSCIRFCAIRIRSASKLTERELKSFSQRNCQEQKDEMIL